MLDVSIIVCTHNPRPHYFGRVLEALRAQTLPTARWELLLIDNASAEPLASQWDLSWHPQARHIREEELGLTAARIRGIRESTGEVIIFVDDDNVLAPDYAAEMISTFNQWPMLGAIGASIKGEFESPAPDWFGPYYEDVVVYELEKNYWSNASGWSKATPYGAGVGVRRFIAEDYVKKVTHDPLRKLLDRTGTSLLMGGDLDLAWCAIDLGLGSGRFTSLKLLHLIPKVRVTEEYVIRLEAGIVTSLDILAAIRNQDQASPGLGLKQKLRFLYNFCTATKLRRSILLAEAKARREAKTLIAAHRAAQASIDPVPILQEG